MNAIGSQRRKAGLISVSRENRCVSEINKLRWGMACSEYKDD